MNIFRRNAKINVSRWDKEKRIMFEMSPSVEGATGQPKAGEQRYDYDKAIRISFKGVDILSAAYTLIGISQGAELELEKFADMSKSSAEGDAKKSLKVFVGDKGIFVGMIMGKQKVNCTISPGESYALGMYLQTVANYWILQEQGSFEKEED